MSGNTYPSSPLRIQLSPAPNPSTPPVNASNGEEPQIWRGSNVALQVGIFDAFHNPVDLSNISQLQIVLLKSPTSLAPAMTKTLSQAQLDATTVTWGNWVAGLGQQATFNLDPDDTDQGCGGLPSAEYWLVIQGTTALNQVIVYGAGFITLFNSGSASLMQLPSTPSYLQWSNPSSAGTTNVVPTTQFSVQEVNITGSAGARTTNLGILGILAGATMRLIFDLPAVSGIVMSITSGPLNAAVYSFTTTGGTGVPKGYIDMHFDGFNWVYDISVGI